MLRNRSRAVTSKQGLMSSPNKNPTTPISSFLGSPRFFNSFLSKTMNEAEHVMSPTSILDTKHPSNFTNPFGLDKSLSKSQNPYLGINKKYEQEAIGLALVDSMIEEEHDEKFSSFVNPFGYDSNQSKPGNPNLEITKSDQEAIGLALIDAINEEKSEGNFSKPVSRMLLFGAKLNVQIPNLDHSSLSPTESPKSPADFGIKTRNSHLSSPFSCTKDSPKVFARQLSTKEMESEDYTCVITHGPNPKTTHIFDNCIVESCCGNFKYSVDAKEYGFEKNVSTSPSVNFMSFCHTCKDSLGEGKDIYMYRGEKAFCSHECRCQEMLFEEMKNTDMDATF